jgi:hypothetical protein
MCPEGDPERHHQAGLEAIRGAVSEAVNLAVHKAVHKAFSIAVRKAESKAVSLGISEAYNNPKSSQVLRENLLRREFRSTFYEALRQPLARNLSQNLVQALRQALCPYISPSFINPMLEIVFKVAAPNHNIPGNSKTPGATPPGRAFLFRAVSGVFSDPALDREAALTKAYIAVFEDLRKRTYDMAFRSGQNGPEASAAYRAAFHLNPTVVQDTVMQAIERPWDSRLSTFSGGMITNQIISVPGLFSHQTQPTSSEDSSQFGKRWKKAHRWQLWGFFVVSSAFYGGAHSLKWHAQFPTEVEALLWRISCCVGAAGILPITMFSLAIFKRPGSLSYSFWVFLGGVTGLLFVAARSYIIIESFISLRALPQSAYQTVEWTNLIPHI